MIALVTGAGSGVGRAIALALAGDGHAVALLGRRPEKLTETADAIAAAGGTALSVAGDASEIPSAQRAVARIEDALGPVDILVNNAGVHGGFAQISESDPQSWRDTLLINVFGPYLLSRLCVDAMRQRGWGRLIQVSSAAGLAAPHSRGSDYVLSKYTLNYFTRQLASELDGTEVSCCAIHPGEVKSEMWAGIRADAATRWPEGEGMRAWAALVERTGGDPPEKAADLVQKIVAAPASETNGRFLWIEGGIHPPREAW